MKTTIIVALIALSSSLAACGTYELPKAAPSGSPSPAPAAPSGWVPPSNAQSLPEGKPLAAEPACPGSEDELPQRTAVDAVGSLPPCDDAHAGWVAYVSSATDYYGCIDHTWELMPNSMELPTPTPIATWKAQQ